MSRGGSVARGLYAAVFVGVIPLGLILWAKAVAPAVPLPAVESPGAGAAVGVVGLFILGAGILTLSTRGGGLPMNAFPPPVLVTTGIFRWVRNPIYLGFGLIAAGASIATGSAAGLWLVTPVTALAMAALVFGYERHDLRRRFGPAALAPTLLSIPRGDGPPTILERAAVVLWVLLPWLVAYFAVQALGPAPDAFRIGFAVEANWPVWQGTELWYASTYLFVPLAPLLARTRSGLGRFAVSGAIATALITLIWLVVPVVASNRPFQPSSTLGALLAFEQRSSTGVAAFPAFHVLWSLLAAEVWVANARATGRPGWAAGGWAWAALITVSTLTTGMHTLPEVLAAILLFPVLRRPERSWEALRRGAERLANSWREWRIGPIRIINHGAYAGAAAGIGLVVAGTALGRGGLAAATWVGFWIVAGAGLWAQWLEGSSALLRPFGWYGGVVGGIFGAFTAKLAGTPVIPLLASFAVAAPWIQIFGRLRCLVQGCCHGGPASDAVGIRYRHRRSRVTQLADLAEVPIHPTPLYSIAGNLVIAVILIRLRVLAAPDSLVLGLYLILSGLARFVEESFRAEPQTPVVGRLRIYQWLAIGSVLAGILCTLLPAVVRPGGFGQPSWLLAGAAAGMGFLTAVAMGVDFPRSNRRFSRLAAAD